jgi:hypothetical protein
MGRRKRRGQRGGLLTAALAVAALAAVGFAARKALPRIASGVSGLLNRGRDPSGSEGEQVRERLDSRARARAAAAGTGGSSSGRSGASGSDRPDPEVMRQLTREQLYGLAQELDVPGRAQMTKEELARSINEIDRRR